MNTTYISSQLSRETKKTATKDGVSVAWLAGLVVTGMISYAEAVAELNK